MKEAGIECGIISLSADFADERHREKILAKRKLLERAKDVLLRKEKEREFIVPDARPVAGLAQQLPFADDTFDRILCDHVIEHIHEQEAFNEVFKEIILVLKPGGKAYVSPVHDDLDGKISDRIQALLPEEVTLIMEEGKGKVSIYDERSMKFRFPILRVILEKSRVENS